MKTLALVVGAAILLTTAHVTIIATGTYGGSHAYLTLAVAGGVAVASILVGRAWGEGRRALAIGLAFAIAAGEVYAFLSTAERLTAAREASQAPLRQRVEASQKLEAKVARAEALLAALPETSARFREAMQGKLAADAAVVTKSAERGCAANCRLLLQAQADQNQQEVEAARRDMAEHRTRLEQAVTDAKGELAAFTVPLSPSPFADRIGWPAWVLDLVLAGLGSVAANGLACLMMVFGSHRRSEQQADPAKTPDVAPVLVLEPVERQQDVDGAQSEKVVQFHPTAPGKRRAKAAGKAMPDAIEQAKKFMVASVTRTDGDAATNMRDLHRGYVTWCETKGVLPKPATEIGPALLHLFEMAQIPIGQKDGKPVALGIALKS